LKGLKAAGVEKEDAIARGDLVYLRYMDNVLFRNSDPSLYNPSVRETVGWLQKQNNRAVWILWERSVEKLPHERTDGESGLVILRSDIIEMRRLQ
jgi:hypothetical protein